MKKTYIHPTIEMVNIDTPQLLYTSNVRLGDPNNTDDEDNDWLNNPDSDGRLYGE